MICQVKNKLTVANFWYLAPKNILKKEEETQLLFLQLTEEQKWRGNILSIF